MVLDPKFGLGQYDLPQNQPLHGETTGRGQDAKKRLYVEFSSTGTGDQNLTSDRIIGPAVKAIQISTQLNPSTSSLGKLEEIPLDRDFKLAKKETSEWTWLPRCFNIFKRTFLVKVGDNYYDMNASSLKKSFGISKEEISNSQNRDITALIANKARERLINYQADAKGVGVSTLNSNSDLKSQLVQAFESDPKDGIKNLLSNLSNLDTLKVIEANRLTIGKLRELNPSPEAQTVIEQGLINYLKNGGNLLSQLMTANEGYHITAEIDTEKAQNISRAAIDVANNEATQINPENSITTTSPKTGEIQFSKIREQRNAAPTPLVSSIFSKTYGKGVQDLIKESKDQFNEEPPTRSIIQAASQYNGAEAGGAFTPLVGLETSFAKGDRTQGPQAQLMEQGMFQAITKAANSGFNAIAGVLRRETLEKQTDDKGKSTLLQSGYLQVGGDTELTKAVTKDFCENGVNLQSPVLKNKGHDLVLSAAPSWQGRIQQDFAKSDEAKDLAYAAAFYNYSALFEHALTQLQKNPGTKIRICPTAIGCGAFANDAASVAKAFNAAAVNFQEELTDAQKDFVKVEMQIYKPLQDFEDKLGIKKSSSLSL